MQKMAIITGGSVGVGFCTALRAAHAGYDLIIASRNETSGKNAKAKIQDKYPEIKVVFRSLDLSDLDSVHGFADSIREPWDLLINNAGAKIQKPFKETQQGHEWHIGVNHLGHFALTALLLPMSQTSATVTSVTSIVATKGQANFSHNQESFNERQAYADSKYLNLAFAAQLAHKLAGTSKNSTVAHPGFARAEPYGNRGIRVAEYLAAQSSWQGSEPVWEATQSPNGTYLVPKILELWGPPKRTPLPEIGQDILDELWQKSEELTGVRFNLQPSFGGE